MSREREFTSLSVRLAERADVEAVLSISNWAAANTPANFAVEPESLESWLETFDAESPRYPWYVATGPDGADQKTMARAVGHGIFCPRIREKVKKALMPIPGATANGSLA